MRRLSFWASLIVVVSVAFAGCNQHEDPVLVDLSQGNPPVSSGATFGSSTVLTGYLVQFDGRVVANGQTTFMYTVSGAGAVHALSSFFLELPACAPAVDSSSPGGATINVSPHTGIYGITWTNSVPTNGSLSYSVTFPGDVPLGVIRAAVKASTDVNLGEIAGPCDGFIVSGTVYVDADSNGVMSGTDESGLVNVTVSMIDDGGNVRTTTTDVYGEYAFLRGGGTYTVRIDAATAADDFNEDLAESFDPTGPTSTVVTVGPDSPGNDFGFNPQEEEIIFELETGVLLTDGETVKFWKKQLRAAGSRGGGGAEFDAAAMTGFVADIQGLFLPEPFQFTPGSEFEEALAILSSTSKDPLDVLLRELLAAEFNTVSGKGLIDKLPLQRALIAWAESVVVDAGSGLSASSGFSDSPLRAASGDSLKDATRMLFLLNGNTGGGSGGGG
jgi:hypothetical protein